VRKARFPFLRTIDDFNFTFQTALRLQMLGSYLGPELVTEGRNAILSGPSGTGKTHLAIAIAYRAIQHGGEARFVGADLLIAELSRAAARGRLEAVLEPYLHPHVLVIDELGYLSHGADAANVLYRVVNERYLQQRPILVTTNKPLAAWGDVVHDGDLAEANRGSPPGAGRALRLARPLLSHSPPQGGGPPGPTGEDGLTAQGGDRI
jgi:DNA replication protein DnaC